MGTRKEFRKQSILSIQTGEKFRHKAPATVIYSEMKCVHELHCLCYLPVPGNGKASAQGLLVPISSNTRSTPKCAPSPCQQHWPSSPRRELGSVAQSDATHTACSWSLSNTVKLQQLQCKALAPTLTVPAAATKWNFLHLQSSSTWLKPGALTSAIAE